jgi:hypothetical protein
MKLPLYPANSLIAFILLLSVSASFVWCPDIECQDEDESDCTCLVCVLNADHSSHSSTGSMNEQSCCSCACQMSVTAPFKSTQLAWLQPQSILDTGPPLLLRGSTQRILRPPILHELFDETVNRASRSTILENKQCSEDSFAYCVA